MAKPITPEVAQEIANQIFAGDKIGAIKIHREHSGEGLKESKDFVESLEADLRVKEPWRFTRSSEDKGRSNGLPLYVCAVLAGLLTVFLWHGKSRALIQRRHMTSVRASPTANDPRPPAVTKAPLQPTTSGVYADGGDVAVSANVMSHQMGQPAYPTELSGCWHVSKPPKMDLEVTLTRSDDKHYRLTPVGLALQGVYAWDGKTLSMESGNQAYRDLTWERTTSNQFVMVKGAYKGATMTREKPQPRPPDANRRQRAEIE